MQPRHNPLLRKTRILEVAALLVASAASASPAEPTPDELIDALTGVFGRHAGMRASHAHGFCAAGEFRPSPQLRQLSRAKLFKATSVPALIRLLVGGGNPKLSDKSRSVRGLAARLQGTGELYDLVMISEPVFFASTPEAFVSFLKARVADPSTGKPDPERVKAHDSRFPSSRNQPGLLASHAAPASYATTPYFSNHAFRFISSAGRTSEVRLVLQPAAGTAYLDSATEAQLTSDDVEVGAAHEAFRLTLHTSPSGSLSQDAPRRQYYGEMKTSIRYQGNADSHSSRCLAA